MYICSYAHYALYAWSKLKKIDVETFRINGIWDTDRINT